MLCVVYRTLNNHIRRSRVPSEQEERKKTELLINCFVVFSVFVQQHFTMDRVFFSGLLLNAICGVSGLRSVFSTLCNDRDLNLMLHAAFSNPFPFRYLIDTVFDTFCCFCGELLHNSLWFHFLLSWAFNPLLYETFRRGEVSYQILV